MSDFPIFKNLQHAIFLNAADIQIFPNIRFHMTDVPYFKKIYGRRYTGKWQVKEMQVLNNDNNKQRGANLAIQLNMITITHFYREHCLSESYITCLEGLRCLLQTAT